MRCCLMRVSSVAIACLIMSACGNQQPDARQIAVAQARSFLGATGDWKLDPSLAEADVQKIRDRAYGFCLARSPADKNCLNEQDHSIFMYASAFAMIRMFRSEPKPTVAYAVALKERPDLFEQVRRYCRSVYEDAGRKMPAV